MKPAVTTSGQPPSSCDLVVVGAGILGLAVARALLDRQPRLRVAVLEREPEIALHQTGHNSGVIHAGVYYTPGSLKAKLCVQGAGELYEYCAERGIACERRGKLIVATDRAELGRLRELEWRARANRVPGVRMLDRHELRELEPHVEGIAALHSPATGVTDFGAAARAYAGDVLAAGGTIHTGCGVERARAGARRLRLEHSRGAVEATYAIFCAGAWSDRLAIACGAGPDPRIVPFRGVYLRLRPERRGLVRGLVYPVPDPALPFLGVHLTRTAGDEVLIGPTALLAGARDAYRLRTIRARDLFETATWSGTWCMLARSWRAGLTEMAHATSRKMLVAAAARYVPELQASDAEPAFAGVRAQALTRDGGLVDDFVVSATERALHVRNAPSPAATSALAIARHVVDEAGRRFGLDSR